MLAGSAVAGWLAGWLTEEQLKNSQALAGNLQKDNYDDILIFWFFTQLIILENLQLKSTIESSVVPHS